MTLISLHPVYCDRCDNPAEPEVTIPDGVAAFYQHLCSDCAEAIYKNEARNLGD